MTSTRNILLGAAFCLTLGATAAFSNDTDDARRIVKQIADGEKTLDHAKTYDNRSSKIEVMDVSIRQLRRAHVLAAQHMGNESFDALRGDADCALVNALDDQAEIYMARSAFPTAKKRVGEALVVEPNDPRSLSLAARIENSMTSNSYQYSGASQRVYDRRGGISHGLTSPGVATPRY